MVIIHYEVPPLHTFFYSKPVESSWLLCPARAGERSWFRSMYTTLPQHPYTWRPAFFLSTRMQGDRLTELCRSVSWTLILGNFYSTWPLFPMRSWIPSLPCSRLTHVTQTLPIIHTCMRFWCKRSTWGKSVCDELLFSRWQQSCLVFGVGVLPGCASQGRNASDEPTAVTIAVSWNSGI